MASAAQVADGRAEQEQKKLDRITREQRPLKRPLVTAKDLILLPAICCGAGLFGALPRPAGMRLARALARLQAAMFAPELKAARLRWLGDLEPAAAEAVLQSHLQERSIATALFFRSLVRGPAYEVELHGDEHIDAALARGKGVILWVSDFLYARDVAKVALSQAGYAVSHLSQPEHGFSGSAFGIRFLNPIRTGFECRFLRERIVYDRSNPGEAVGRLMQRLADNGIVSITATAAEGRKVWEAGFLNGRIRLAPGAPKFGYRSGAPVLPVFAVPDPAAPRFRVVVGRPLKMDGPGEAAAIATTVTDYVARLEGYVRKSPQLWAGWDMVRR